MATKVIQDWTDSTVLLKFGEHKDVRYKVYQDGAKVLQEIRDLDDFPIHTLELPPGLCMEKQSYEVLLRYVLLDLLGSDSGRNRGMNQLDHCLQKISWGKIDGALQKEVADKILELLEQEKASLGTRKKTLFAQAITSLSASINSFSLQDETPLKRCLTTLQKVITPENEPDESYAQTDDESEDTSYEMLVSTVKMIKGQIF